MARGINKVILVARLGKDPEARYMPSGACVCNFSVATSMQWKDKNTGEKREETEWHQITAFGKLGEICAEYLRKGSNVYLEGRLKTEKWQDQNGVDKYTTKVIVNEMQILDSRGDQQQNNQGQQQQGSSAQQYQNATGGNSGGSTPPTSAADFGDFDDDIPF